METILDYNPTPRELCSLGITDAPDDPLTDEARRDILGFSEHDQYVSLASLMFMRFKGEEGMRFLKRLPQDDPSRRGMEEELREWSILWPENGAIPPKVPPAKHLAHPVPD